MNRNDWLWKVWGMCKPDAHNSQCMFNPIVNGCQESYLLSSLICAQYAASQAHSLG